MLGLLAILGIFGGVLLFDIEHDDTTESEDDEHLETKPPFVDDNLGDPRVDDDWETPETHPDESNGSEKSGDFTHVFGTASADVLSGVNVRIDVASGIVNLGSDTAEILNGGEGDDTLLLGEGDIGIGGDGEDEFLIDGDIDSVDVPRIEDFVKGDDVLHISLPSSEEDLEATWPDRPEFSGEVGISFDGNTTIIEVDGNVTCLLTGLHDIDPEDILVSFDYHSDVPTDFDLFYGYA